jgi:hypothetical protein
MGEIHTLGDENVIVAALGCALRFGFYLWRNLVS